MSDTTAPEETSAPAEEGDETAATPENTGMTPKQYCECIDGATPEQILECNRLWREGNGTQPYPECD